MGTTAGDQTRSYGRTAGLLTIALATAGGLAYLFFAVASHTLSEDDYGLLVVLWSITFLTISVLFRPVEQLLARTVAELEERKRPTAHAVRVGAIIQALLAGAFAVAVMALRAPLERSVFDGQSVYVWTLLVAVLAFAASYFARGYFAGSKRMRWYAAILIVEGLVRLALALIVAVGIASGSALMVIAIAAAPTVSLMVVPVALRRTKSRRDQPAESREVADFTLAQGGGFASAILVIMLCEQVLLLGGVLFVRATEDAAAAGFIFNLLMVARAPVVLFQAIAASLLPHLTRLRSRGDELSDHAFSQSVRLTLQVVTGFTVAVMLGLLAIGPQVMQIAFGDNFEYDRLGLLVVAGGMGFYLAAGTLNQAALAQGQVRRAATCWIASAAVFALVNIGAAGGDAFRSVEIAFAASAALLFGSLLYAGYEVPTGSAREIELQLAAADDAV